MANDRNRLEQEALLHLNKGSLDGALNAYLQILKLDPKDRRLRQKVGELYLKLNRPQDAIKHLREVANGLVQEGNHRPAIAILKQVIAVVADDPSLHMDLGECYLASGYPNDARTAFDMAMRLYINLLNPALAAKAARKVADLSPGEPALKLRVAELIEQSKDPTPALAVYQEVMAEYRRRGRPDEVGRVAELALRLKPDDMGLVLDAAAARVEGQEWKKAIAHLQPAFKVAPNDPRVLDLLARTFEGLEQPDRALKVLLELARVAADRKDAVAETDALRRASKLGMEDDEVRSRLAIAEAKLARTERRLSALALYQPTSEGLLRVQARAETLARYGFPDRAESELGAALKEDPTAPSLLAAYGEILVAVGRVEEGISWMEKLIGVAGAEKALLLDRIAVLRGEEEAPPELKELVDDEEAPDADVEEIIDDEEDDEEVTNPRIGLAPLSAEARGDELAAKGDIPGALLAWREALAENPANEQVLQKIAALRSRARDQAPPAPAAPVAPPAAPRVAVPPAPTP
ncbi:MAG TPA: tetratricopeptide repeat protein, partial [Myxococcota bacterium]|nr:tetratricopeptide repeat protein [Myxococcota bacterium]